MKKITALLLLASMILSGATLTSCRGRNESPSIRTSKSSVIKKTSKSLVTDSDIVLTTTESITLDGTNSLIPPSSNEAPPPDDTDVLILTGCGISLYYRSVVENVGDLKFTFFIRNNSNIPLIINLDIQALNRYMFGTTEYVDLLPGCSAVILPIVHNYTEKAPSITKLSDIELVTLKVSFFDDSYMKVYEDCTFTFTIHEGDL